MTQRRLSLPLAAVAAALSLAVQPAAGSPASSTRGPERTASVIVREHPHAGNAPERAVARLGGSVGRHIKIIDGFVARIPASRIASLRATHGVDSVTPNRRVVLQNYLDGWDHTHDLGSMYYVAQEVTGAGEFWNNGLTGKGVDVALIDSGVVPVEGLKTSNKVIHGPDLSFESQADNLRYLDTYGHGTHLAGIIAGRDGSTPALVQKGENKSFVGMAPDARIVSIKVADAFGNTDVSQVLAAIDWVVQHRNTGGLNIRVLNLSFGTDGEQDYRIDPLAYAVEVAWRKGIVVVVAAGNGGFGSAKLNNPAYDPFVIAVGGVDDKGTYDWKDDVVPPWSSFGDGARNPDLVASGKSIVSLRAPGSNVDVRHPAGRVGATRFFRGSGTSQAAAVVSGAAALIIQQRPQITPDQMKALLKKTASRLDKADSRGQGAGMLNLKLARDSSTPSSVQTWTPSTGTGSLEAARGSSHVATDGVELRGERDIFGAPFDSTVWAPLSLASGTWNSGTWNGNVWSGAGWTSGTWNSGTWNSGTWNSGTWNSGTWNSGTWNSGTWNSGTWSSGTWNSGTWNSGTWNSGTWSSGTWSSGTWN